MTHQHGAGWAPAITVPNSYGRSSTRVSAARSVEGDLWLAWPTDHRTTAYAHRPIRGKVWTGRLAALETAPDPAFGPLDLATAEIRP